jgi:hypothetical protein
MEMRKPGVSLQHNPHQSLIQLGLNQTLVLSSCLSMIFSENRFPLFRIML